MGELRELLYSLAERLTKSPVGRKVHSTSEGLQVTALIDIQKFSKLYSEREIDAVLTELEKEFVPDLGVSRTLTSIRLSRFIAEGGPWVEEPIPGIRYVYEVGKPIAGQIHADLAKRWQENHTRSADKQKKSGSAKVG